MHRAFMGKKRGKRVRRKRLMGKQWVLKRGTHINAYDMDRQIEADPLYQKEIAEIARDALKNWRKRPALNQKEFRELLDRLTEGVGEKCRK